MRRLSRAQLKMFFQRLDALRERKLYELHMQALARINANSQGLMFFKRQAT